MVTSRLRLGLRSAIPELASLCEPNRTLRTESFDQQVTIDRLECDSAHFVKQLSALQVDHDKLTTLHADQDRDLSRMEDRI